jgi:phage tail-like protein
MAVKGTPRSFHKKFAFVVEIEGVAVAAFTKCSELSAEVAVVTQNEGGRLIPYKSPGRVTVSDVTLERGVANGDSDLYDWFLEVVTMSANSGLVDDEYKRSVEVIQLDRNGNVLRRWVLDGAWPTKMVVGEWDNDADENVVESVTLAIDTFDKLAG